MANPRWLSTEEQRDWRAFLEATRLLFDQLDRELRAAAGISLSYYEILVRLSEAPDRTLRMSELADRLLHSPSRLSHAISRLEELGWVARTSCPTDKRGLYAVLTDEGFAALEAAAPNHVEGVRSHLLDQLTADQYAQLGEISRAIRDHLHADRHAAGEREPAEAAAQ